MVSLADRRRGAEYLEGTYAVSERRACQAVDVARSTKRRCRLQKHHEVRIVVLVFAETIEDVQHG